MKKCKNIECDNEIIEKRVYCSLTCRNIYVNKHIRDYKKTSDGFKKVRKEKEKEYLKSPKECKECDKIISYKKRRNSYCGSSCMAKHTNKEKEYTWGDKISEGLKKYSISIGNHVGLYKLICNHCETEFEYKRKEKKYCSDKCRIEYGRRNMSEYQKYKQDTSFKFSLNDYPDEFDFDLIREYGWYSPTNKKNNLGGVSRDHILSVREGFELGIDPFLLAHPANCRLMIHTDNISKNKKSDINFKELMNRIKKFDNRYAI